MLDIYLEGKGISPEEYQLKKAKLLNAKGDIEQGIKNFGQKRNNRLEPITILLSQGDKKQIREFLKNVGSNFILNAKRLEISPRNG